MPSSLRYGYSSAMDFRLPEDSLLLDRRGPQGEPLDDPAAAVAAALANPIEFPPLAKAITTDDRVALALSPGVPQAEAVVAGVIYALTEAGIAPEQITIVQSASEAKLEGRDLRAGLPLQMRQQVQLATHDPTERTGLAYLAASEQGEAVYFHRDIGDADLVIPIVCLRGEDVLGEYGPQAGLYPTFADESAQQRFHALSSHEVSQHREQRAKEADEANWLLGVMLCVGVLPAAGDGVLEVLVGERAKVAELGRQLCGQAWAFDIPQRAELVIATIEGGPEQQTWENVGCALHAASQAVEHGGAIVICCDLAEGPGPSVQRLAADGTSDETMRDIRRDQFADTLTASQLGRLNENYRLYLRSRLNEDVVESLGMGHVACDEDLLRLASRHRNYIVLGNAQFAMPRSDDA